MYFQAIAGIVAGLCAGVVSGIMFLLMRVPQHDGLAYSVLTVISRAIGSNDPSVGWSYHLFNAAVIGVIFGVIVGRSVNNLFTAVALGLVASLSSWLLAGLILLPRVAESGSGFADLVLSPLGLATLIGSGVQGILLGAIYLWVYNPIRLDEIHMGKVYRSDNCQTVAADKGVSGRIRS